MLGYRLMRKKVSKERCGEMVERSDGSNCDRNVKGRVAHVIGGSGSQ
jgi:hypothetical protein